MDPFLSTGKLSVISNEKSHNETRRKFMEYSSSSSYSSSNKVRRKRDEDAVKAEAYTDRKHVINLVSVSLDFLCCSWFSARSRPLLLFCERHNIKLSISNKS